MLTHWKEIQSTIVIQFEADMFKVSGYKVLQQRYLFTRVDDRDVHPHERTLGSRPDHRPQAPRLWSNVACNKPQTTR